MTCCFNKKMKKIWLSSIIYALLLTVLWSGSVLAQDSAPTPGPITDDQVNAIAKNMYCPVCENTPLDVCPTQACAEWRELIRDKLAEGWNEQQIRAYFVERFGDRVLATPPARGLNWLVYVIPPIAFLAGLYLLYRAFLSMRASTELNTPTRVTPEGSEGEPESPKDPYLDRLEEELRKM